MFGPFDILVFAMAAPQSIRCVPNLGTPFVSQLNKIKMTTNMVAIITVQGNQSHLPQILQFPGNYEIDKMIRQTSTTNSESTTWVAHASAWWSIPRYEKDKQEIGLELEKICLALLSEIEQKEVKVSDKTVGHRWGMSRCIQSIQDRCIQD